MSSSQTRALARRLASLERARLASKQPTLSFSTIDDGAITAVDVDGNLTMVIGKQYDETNTSAVVTGPPPPAPSVPGVTEVLGGLLVYWDGTFAGGEVSPMDWSRVTVHAVPTSVFSGADPLDQTHIVGSFVSATGGEILVGLGYVEHVVYLVAWSQAGKFSDPSSAVVGTPKKIDLPDFGAEAAAELAKAQEALEAADAAGASASSASSAATAAQTAAEAAADDAAEAAGLVAGKAVIKVQTATPGVGDQNANTLWIDTTSGNNTPKRWNGSSWVAITDKAATDAAAAAAAAVSAVAAATAAADDAHDAAVAAAAAADAAGALATSAMTAANGKNKIIRATYAPTNEANTAGDTWWYRDGTTGKILGLYMGAGATSWVATTITNEIIGNLDAGKITFGTMSGERIEVGSITIAHVDGLTELADDITGTVDTVSGWTYTGQTTIDGGKVQTDTITSVQIHAGSVTAVEADIASLWAGFLGVGYVQAGFVLAGKLQVGTATWDPINGLIIPQPDGGTITLPADGVTPATITARLVATALTVKDDLTISGFGELLGEFQLANGITPPVVEPDMSSYWPSFQSAALQPADGSSNGEIYHGLVEHSSSVWAVAVSYFGAAIRLINKSDGSSAAFPDPTNGAAWTGSFIPFGGIAKIGSYYYVLGSDSSRASDVYIYRINATTWAKTSEIKLGNWTFFPKRPRITANPNGDLNLIWTDGGVTRIRYFAADLSASVGTVALISTSAAYAWGGAAHGAFAGDSTRLYVMPSSFNAQCFTGTTTFTATTSQNFQRANASTMMGLAYDSATQRMWSYDEYGRFYQYSDVRVDTGHQAAYTWYDGDNSVYPSGTLINGIDKSGLASGVHQTTGSPVGSLTLPARSFLKVTMPPPPEEKVTDSTRVDKANRIGFYASKTSVSAPKLQSFLTNSGGTAVRTATVEIPTTGGSTVPVTNTFSTAAVPAPGKITSAAARLDGKPKTQLNGSGVADRIDGLIPPGCVQMFAGSTIPAGWLNCDGSSYSTATYPDLFAAIGYTYGGSSGTFKVPDTRRRFPIGVSSTWALGSNEGETTETARTPQHNHAVGTLTVGDADLNRQTNTTATGSAARLAPTSSLHDHPLTGSVANGGGLSSGGTPNLALNFIIRT